MLYFFLPLKKYKTTRKNKSKETTNSVDFDLIWDKLHQMLPKYMIPNKIKTINYFPRSENGKINKILLKNKYFKSKNDIDLE